MPVLGEAVLWLGKGLCGVCGMGGGVCGVGLCGVCDAVVRLAEDWEGLGCVWLGCVE